MQASRYGAWREDYTIPLAPAPTHAKIKGVAESVNPFFHRGPVRAAAYFFGRAREVAFAADLLRQGQSLAVHGPRRFGKTSLLFYLAQPEVAAAHGLGPETTRWVYLEGGALDGLDEEWFYGAIDRALGGEAEAVPYGAFVDRLRGLAVGAAPQRVVAALDEFELIAANPRLGPAFFNRLRGLAAQFPIQFITASKDSLGQLTFAQSETLSSPFFNIFAPLPLGLLTEAEARALLDTLARRAGQAFSAATLDFVLQLAGPHPLFLQVAGYRAFAALERGGQLSPEKQQLVLAQTLSDLEPHLTYYWNGLEAEARYTLAALPLWGGAQPPAGEGLQAAGLVQAGHYLGQALEDFVRRQKVAGLLQGGPFIVDTRRGQVVVRGELVHLTPTEFAAFKLFLERPGQMFTPEEIEAALWPGEQSLDVERARGVVKKLRAALGPAGELLVNRRGQGYLLALA